ncbi:gag-pol polyprotein [Trifolium medium]|uniref:Gag-pol polyprotein n=1 Tax=Trifolium medium TaxID=97028 RepID=A0A392MGZ8_9FABA|nr:gag-pol polyprotein [Trifolium medium]
MEEPQMLQMWHERVRKGVRNNKKNGKKSFEVSTSQGCVTSTSDDGEIMHSEVATSYKGGRRLNDVWIIDSGAT